MKPFLSTLLLISTFSATSALAHQWLTDETLLKDLPAGTRIRIEPDPRQGFYSGYQNGNLANHALVDSNPPKDLPMLDYQSPNVFLNSNEREIVVQEVTIRAQYIFDPANDTYRRRKDKEWGGLEYKTKMFAFGKEGGRWAQIGGGKTLDEHPENDLKAQGYRLEFNDVVLVGSSDNSKNIYVTAGDGVEREPTVADLKKTLGEHLVAIGKPVNTRRRGDLSADSQ